MEFRLKQFVPSEICLACDVCCRFIDENSIWAPVFTDIDIKKLQNKLVPLDFFTKEKRLRLKPYKEIFTPSDSEHPTEFVCLYFNPEEKKCNIYPSRPFDCQLYPFLITKKDEKIFLGFDLKCPFAKSRQGTSEFRDFVGYLVEFLKRKDIKAMIKNNPQIAIDYKNDVVFLEEIDFL